MISSTLSLSTAAPEIFLAAAALLLLITSVFCRESCACGRFLGGVKGSDIPVRGGEPPACLSLAVRFSSVFSLAGILVTMLLVGLGPFTGTEAGQAISQAGGATQTGSSVAFSGLFVSDAFARMVKQLVLGAGFITILSSLSFLRNHDHGMARPEYPVLVMFALLGGMVMASAKDFLALYVGLELQSMALYILAAFQRDKASAADGGIKYFILGTLASALLLYGISLLYGFSGSTLYDPLLMSLQKGDETHLVLVKIGMAFVFAGFCFKISIAPFHLWTADVYESAPTPTTSLFATVAKISAFAALTRLLPIFHEGLQNRWGHWEFALQGVAVASILVGACGGLAQTRLKRLLGFSAILNMGFSLLPLALGASSDLLQAAWIYLGLYTLNILGFFAVLLALRRDGTCISRIQDLAGLGKTHPALAAGLACFLFSLAGVPPLVGFWGKFFLFQSLIAQDALALAVFGLVASVATAGYYLRLVKIMYFEPVASELDPVPEMSLRAVVVGVGVLVFLLTLVPSPWVLAVESAAESLRLP